MDPGLRTALLILGLFFVGSFVAMTLSVAASYGFDVLSVAALLIAVLLALPLIGALRNPPE